MMVLKKFKIERRSKMINFPNIATGSAIKQMSMKIFQISRRNRKQFIQSSPFEICSQDSVNIQNVILGPSDVKPVLENCNKSLVLSAGVLYFGDIECISALRALPLNQTEVPTHCWVRTTMTIWAFSVDLANQVEHFIPYVCNTIHYSS